MSDLLIGLSGKWGIDEGINRAMTASKRDAPLEAR